jgi:plastocyanin
MNDIDALLLGLDAEPGPRLTLAETARSERLLAQITQCAPSSLAQSAGARPAAVRRRPPARFALSAAGVAAAALVVGLVAGGQFLGHAADHQTGQAQAPSGLTLTELADWTAVPGHPAVTSPVVRQAAGTCVTSFFRDAAAFTDISDVDQRGSVLTLLATDPASDTAVFCMTASGHGVFGMVVNSPSFPLPAIGATAVNDLIYGFAVAPGTTSEAFGQAGSDVTGLSFKTLAGETITATVQDGFWSLWWPPSRSDADVGGTVTWTTADGASHTAPLLSINANSKKPTTGNGKPSAIPVGG